MKLVFSWDDGALEDQRLFNLHEKYEVPAMFFVPTKNREGRKVLPPAIIRSAESPLISFGGHTENHTFLTNIPLESVEQEVLLNKQYLEDVLGHRVTDFCLPGGKYNQHILEIVAKHYQTIRTADTMNFRTETNLLKPSIHVYPRGHKSLLGNASRHHSFVELAYLTAHLHKDYFDLIQGLLAFERHRKNRTVIIWGHSWELEKFDLWGETEKLLRIAKAYQATSYKELIP